MKAVTPLSIDACGCNLCRNQSSHKDSSRLHHEARQEALYETARAVAPVRLVPRFKRMAAESITSALGNPVATAS